MKTRAISGTVYVILGKQQLDILLETEIAHPLIDIIWHMASSSITPPEDRGRFLALLKRQHDAF
jgi:hypothetical protein